MAEHRKSPAVEPRNLAVEGTQSEGLGIDSLSGKLQRYAGGKERALRMLDYIRVNHPDEINFIGNLRDCGSYLVFKHFYTIDELRLHGAVFCKKHLICPFCAMRRAVKYLQAYIEKIEHLEAEGVINADLRPYFVTLTVKDRESLSESFNGLKSAFRRYTQQRRNALKGKTSCEFAKAEGGVYSYEVKRGSGSGLWHPHLHCVWWCREAPDAATLSAEWKALTGDSFIVDVRPLTAREGQSSLVAGFIEVFKYALKFSEMDLADNWEAFQYLSGRRLVSSFGFLRGVKLPDNLLDEDIQEALPYYKLFYAYVRGNYTLYRTQEFDGSQDD